MIWLGRVAGLDAIEDAATRLTFGAGVDARRGAMPHLAAHRSRPRRTACAASAGSRCATAGTVGGNIANGSPIGDCRPR